MINCDTYLLYRQLSKGFSLNRRWYYRIRDKTFDFSLFSLYLETFPSAVLRLRRQMARDVLSRRTRAHTHTLGFFDSAPPVLLEPAPMCSPSSFLSIQLQSDWGGTRSSASKLSACLHVRTDSHSAAAAVCSRSHTVAEVLGFTAPSFSFFFFIIDFFSRCGSCTRAQSDTLHWSETEVDLSGRTNCWKVSDKVFYKSWKESVKSVCCLIDLWVNS